MAPSKTKDAAKGYWGQLSHCMALSILDNEQQGTYLISYRHKQPSSTDRDYYIYCRGRLPIRVEMRNDKLNISNLRSLANKIGTRVDIFDMVASIRSVKDSPLKTPLPYVEKSISYFSMNCEKKEAEFARKRLAGLRVQDTIEARVSQAVMGVTIGTTSIIAGAAGLIPPLAIAIGIGGAAVGMGAGLSAGRFASSLRGDDRFYDTEQVLASRPRR